MRTEDVVKLAVGQAKLPDEAFTDWEAVLSEIVVSDAFGVDRMDYLLRDSLHAGVGYGKFDHYRLIDSLRILPEMTILKNLHLDLNGVGYELLKLFSWLDIGCSTSVFPSGETGLRYSS